jgi:hypothetical protein
LTWNRLVQLLNLPASSVTQDSPNSLIPTETRPQLTGQLTTRYIQPTQNSVTKLNVGAVVTIGFRDTAANKHQSSTC